MEGRGVSGATRRDTEMNARTPARNGNTLTLYPRPAKLSFSSPRSCSTAHRHRYVSCLSHPASDSPTASQSRVSGASSPSATGAGLIHSLSVKAYLPSGTLPSMRDRSMELMKPGESVPLSSHRANVNMVVMVSLAV